MGEASVGDRLSWNLCMVLYEEPSFLVEAEILHNPQHFRWWGEFVEKLRDHLQHTSQQPLGAAWNGGRCCSERNRRTSASSVVWACRATYESSDKASGYVV